MLNPRKAKNGSTMIQYCINYEKFLIFSLGHKWSGFKLLLNLFSYIYEFYFTFIHFRTFFFEFTVLAVNICFVINI